MQYLQWMVLNWLHCVIARSACKAKLCQTRPNTNQHSPERISGMQNYELWMCYQKIWCGAYHSRGSTSPMLSLFWFVGKSTARGRQCWIPCQQQRTTLDGLIIGFQYRINGMRVELTSGSAEPVAPLYCSDDRLSLSMGGIVEIPLLPLIDSHTSEIPLLQPIDSQFVQNH